MNQQTSHFDPTWQIDMPEGLDLKPHPCPYSDGILDVYQHFIDIETLFLDQPHFNLSRESRARLLDPMAGIGRMHELQGAEVYTNELEPEWAYHHPKTTVCDARSMPMYDDEFFDYVFFSPPYANRLGDNYAPSPDKAKGRKSYRISLDREMSQGSTSCLQWNRPDQSYQQLSIEVIKESLRLLKTGGFIGINVKGHYRDNELIEVDSWYDDLLTNTFDMCYVWGVELDQKGFTFAPAHTNQRDFEKVLFYQKVK